MNVKCDYCGKEFSKRKSHVREKNYCSTDCYASSKRKERIETICAYCGKQIERPKHKILENNFCDRNCHMKYMNAKLNPTRMTESVKEKISITKTDPNRKGYRKIHGVHEHRLVAESMLGRKLRKGEVVHHIDGNKSNNNIENLMIFSSQKDHAKWHSENDPKWGGGANAIYPT